jgi:hypothetical protein
MGSTPGQRLLFGGCSAGAIGAMNNIDDVAAMVPRGLQVQGLLDASSLVDIRPTGWQFSNDLIPLQTLISEMVGFVKPTFDPACAAKYSGVSAWKCLLGQYRMPLLTTPYFANSACSVMYGCRGPSARADPLRALISAVVQCVRAPWVWPLAASTNAASLLPVESTTSRSNTTQITLLRRRQLNTRSSPPSSNRCSR